jgi:Prp8 binding protein
MPEERASAYSGNKRPHNQLGLVPVKKLKSELSTSGGNNQLIPHEEEKKVVGPRHMLKYTGPINRALVEQGVKRTSNLLAPIMLLEGHDGEIYCGKFAPDGRSFISAGFDRHIMYWDVFGECTNYHQIPHAHKGAILDLQFGQEGETIFTAASDQTVGMFDYITGTRIKRMKGHGGIVNSVHPARRGEPLVASASDDNTIKIWDTRRKGPIDDLRCKYQMTAVSFNDTSDQVICAGIDNIVKIYDRRAQKVQTEMKGHNDTVTSMSLSNCGSFILTNSMDNSLRVWDIRPFVTKDRMTKMFIGHKHNFEKNLLKCAWSPDDQKVTCGSADRFVYVWDVQSRSLQYKLPGHIGSVNEVQFYPDVKDPIVASCASDKTIYLGEIQKTF